MTAAYLSVVGIRPADDAVRPAGLHLRWSFPPSWGFPARRFDVYRRPSAKRSLSCADFDDVAAGQTLTSGWSRDGVSLFFSEPMVSLAGSGNGWLDVSSSVPPPAVERLRIELARPAVEVGVRYSRPTRDPSEIELRGYDADGALVVATAAPETQGATLLLRAGGPPIARAVVPLAFGRLHAVCVSWYADACDEAWDLRRARLPLLEPPSRPARIADVLVERLGPDVRNYYVADFEAALRRYGRQLPELLDWLRALCERDPARIVVDSPDDPPHRWRARPPDGARLTTIYPQAILLLAAIDPNIARLLSLGWVDRYDGDDDAPSKHEAYDYKVVGDWPDGPRCGFVFGVGPTESDLPTLDPSEPAVWGHVLPGIRWRGTSPRPRVGVGWRRPPTASGPGAAVRPVLYEVVRTPAPPTQPPRPDRRTGDQPVLVPPNAWGGTDATLFVDDDVPLGNYQYAVSGIDLFGQLGRPVATQGPVAVVDAEPPPPPIRLAARLEQAGYPWRTAEQRASAASVPAATLDLAFEYGAFQHRQGPDVASFTVFWRDGGLVESRVVDLVVVGGITAGDETAYLVRVEGDNLDLGRYVGGTLSTEVPAEDPPPVAERRHVRVVAEENGILRLAPIRASLPAGRYRLVADARRADLGWQEIVTIQARPPVQGILHGAPATSLTVTVQDIPPPAPPAPDPFALLPAGARPTGVDPSPGLDARIDRALLEPDLFAGVTAGAAGQVVGVLRSGSGRASTADGGGPVAGLRLEPGAASLVSEGDQLSLPVPPATDQGALRLLVVEGPFPDGLLKLPGGEVSFIVRRDGEDVLVAARVVSDVRREGNRFDLLVWVPAGVDPNELRDGAAVTYVAPYRLSGFGVDVFVGDRPASLASSTRPAVSIPPDRGATAAYLAVAATDARGNRGPLSEAVQVSAVRPPPGGAPTAPFPCDRADAAEGYLSPPNRRGRATICLAWAYVPPNADPSGLRYEVARALDAGLVAADRRAWLLGRQAPGAPPARTDPGLQPVPLTIGSVADAPGGRHRVSGDLPPGEPYPDAELANGLLWQDGRSFALVSGLSRAGTAVTLDVEPDPAGGPAPGPARLYPLPIRPGRAIDGEIADDPVAREVLFEVRARGVGGGSIGIDSAGASGLAGGRLIQDGRTYQITKGALDSELVLLLRPLGRPEPPRRDGACQIDGPPDYARLLGNLPKLRQLAAKPALEEAFGLVTGVPIAETRFRDEAAGRGRNAFFYRVRAVDAAENRTDWSPVSVPFRQADTTPPAAPRDLAVLPGDRAALLRWAPPVDPSIVEYHVYRSEGSDPEFQPTSSTPRVVQAAEVEPSRPTVIAGTVALPRGVSNVAAVQTIVRIAPSTGSPPNLFVRSEALTRLLGRRVRSVNPLVPDETGVRIAIGDPANPTVLTRRPGSGEPLMVQSGGVDLTFGLQIAAIERVVRAEYAPDGSDPAAALALPSSAGPDTGDVTIDLTSLTIGGFDGLLPDGTRVVAIVRLAEGSLVAIRHAPGTTDPLRVAGGRVSLDLTIPDESLIGVHAVGGDGPDLRLTRPSVLVTEPGSGRATAIAGLNPLVPDGTTVSVALRDTAGTAHVFDGDPAVLTWRDEGLRGGVRYSYRLAAIRRVWTAGANGAPVERLIRGDLAGPIMLIGLDRSTPAAPVLTEAAWVDPASGAPALPVSTQVATRLTIRAPAETTAWVRAQRAPSAEGPWANARGGAGPGWLAWPSGAEELAVLDEEAAPSARWVYRAQLRTADDRISPFSEPLVHEPRPAGG